MPISVGIFNNFDNIFNEFNNFINQNDVADGKKWPKVVEFDNETIKIQSEPDLQSEMKTICNFYYKKIASINSFILNGPDT
jgi:lantibiotic modifying enzyme